MKKKIMLATMLTALSLNLKAAPIFNIFELGVQNRKKLEYNKVGENNITKSLKNEKGTLGMFSVSQKDDEYLTYMFEVYLDDDAYKTHINSEQYKYFLEKSPEILTEHKKKINVTPQLMIDRKIDRKLNQTKNLRVNYTIVELKEGGIETFKKAVFENMEDTMKLEKDVYLMYGSTETDNPNRWHFFEIYKDTETYEKHRQTPHFKKYIEATDSVVANKKLIETTVEKVENKGGLYYNNIDNEK